jgi:hypothetical protein
MVNKILILVALITLTSSAIASSPICDVCHFMMGTIQKSVPKYPAISILSKIAY